MDILNIIKKIEKAKGNEKIEIIKAHPELKKALNYAYNPFKKYYLTAPDLNGVDDPMAMNYIPFTELDDLINRDITGKSAYENICDFLICMNINTAEVFKMIINKDLRCGINIKSINKAFPGLIPLVFDGSEKPPVMLLKTFDPKKVKYPCLAAVKKDGIRGLHVGKMLSRSGHKLIGHNHIENKLEESPHNFDGELCVPGMIFDDASGLIRDKNTTPNSIYWIFDIPSFPGTKKERYNWLYKNLLESNHIRLIKHYTITNYEKLMHFYTWALEQGEEGIVIYDPDSLYEDKRSYDWMRLVPIKSADCKVIGFFEGEGKHAGSLGGIIINYKNHEVRVGTGFSEKVKKIELNQLVSSIDKKLLTLKNKKLEGYSIEQISPIWQKIRQFIWDNQNQFLGAIAKIEYKEKTKAGSMRQPRFKTWRWDK